MGGCTSKHDDVEPVDIEVPRQSLFGIGLLFVELPEDPAIHGTQDGQGESGIILVPHTSSSKSDILCGVSNVIYRKE